MEIRSLKVRGRRMFNSRNQCIIRNNIRTNINSYKLDNYYSSYYKYMRRLELKQQNEQNRKQNNERDEWGEREGEEK